MDPNFPLSEWDRFLEQANITLNLLRSARSNPKLSAYAYMFGEFDFAATTLAPPGTKIVAHIKPNQRRIWELNGEAAWYVGLSITYCRGVTYYFPRIKTIQDCATVPFYPSRIPFAEVKLEDFLRQAASDIISILTLSPSRTTPSLQAGDPVRNVLTTLATQLKRIEHIPDTTSPITAACPRMETPTLPKYFHVPATFPRVVNLKPYTQPYTHTSVL